MITLLSLFDWLLSASLRASLLTLLVLGLQWLLKHRIGPRAHYSLWLPVLVVLIMPVLPQSRWSVENLWVTEDLPANAPPPAASAETSSVAPAVKSARHEQRVMIDWARVSVAAWATISAALLLISGFSFLRTLRRYRMTSTRLSDAWMAEIVAAAQSVGLRRAPRVWCSTAVTSPAVTGLWRPVLLLPANFEHEFTPAEARLILRHELTHLKRHDLPLNALLCVLMALHWFSPLLWLAFWKARADREAACDAQVLRDASPQRRVEYGHALLKAETAFSPLRLSLGFVGLFQRGSLLRSRIQSIAINHPTHPAMKLLTLSCVALMTFFGVTRADNRADEKTQIMIEAKFIEISSAPNQPADIDRVLAEMLTDPPKSKKEGQPLIAVLDDPQFQIAIRRLSQRKGVDLLSAPKVTTHAGQKATVEVSREFALPDGQKQPDEKVGVSLEMLPKISKSGMLDLALDPRVVEFDGFEKDAQGDAKPMFTVRSTHARVSLASGQTALIDLGSRIDQQQVEEEGADGKIVGRTDRVTRRAIAFVTARVVEVKPGKTGGKPSPVKSQR